MIDDPIVQIKENYLKINDTIIKAIKRSGKYADGVKLVVVTKGQPSEKVNAVIEAGARILGENYPEETLDKIDQIKSGHSIEWHMIGHLQSRKIPIIVTHFNAIHSLDNYALAEKLSNKLTASGKSLRVLLEFNVGGEDSKFGFQAFDENLWSTLLKDFERILALPGIDVVGLMTMPPYFDNPEGARPFFKKLRKLRDFFQKQLKINILNELSMGTSGDFEVAIEEGATYLRVGHAIMGKRIVK